ncbi:aminoacyl-histidine dipeptidase [Aureibaculum sp. 2210JD6-5]|uniref:aminoacyl-histidine dipeptidase n=1 Tax=Aureibaculum sp. 2210JD6-5 TaxID=3103957 RepID=UPI002AAEFE0C|nr:aminoacyl-histidine dipeptidase [Aureibaculum sp. 2210JD6-5]MDY7393724.1 aminoacyl-histidine dipeptidase [Aureibaculum sp. 2210JD6-5]
MNKEIRNLEPKAIWNNFADLNAVPRASKKEERVIEFMVDFGKKLDLPTKVDKVGNVIITKPATKGMENRKTVVLQSHLDMVHQKNNDTNFDFDTQGIEMLIDGDWVKAKGTTLGADNGLGVATIMSILETKDIEHPALEALFTIDEETGMTGAMGLEAGWLKGEILLNLDTEDDDEIGVGCAGGIDITATKPYNPIRTAENVEALKITVKGLQGGHSGMDIHKGLGNANKIMNRVLFDLKKLVSIAEIDGGGLRNAIPRESNAIVVTQNKEEFSTQFNTIAEAIISEYKSIEKDLEITFKSCDRPAHVLSKQEQATLLKTIYAIHNGVFRMSPDIADLVETSNNVARVLVKDGEIKILCLTRSSVESGKANLVNTISSVFQLAHYSVKTSGTYPGWKPNPDSEILKVLDKTYQDLFKEKANIMACHAGLECGILGQNYPSMDMISFGPTIKGAHSPDERASISSTQKFWKYVQEILKEIPEKK